MSETGKPYTAEALGDVAHELAEVRLRAFRTAGSRGRDAVRELAELLAFILRPERPAPELGRPDEKREPDE